MRSMLVVALGFAAALAAGGALAQAYPTKPVKLIVTYPPGGSSDLMARVFGQKLGEVWGQSVIVESKPGAAGSTSPMPPKPCSSWCDRSFMFSARV